MRRAAVLVLPLLVAVGVAQERSNLNIGQANQPQVQNESKPDPIVSPPTPSNSTQPADQSHALPQGNQNNPGSGAVQPSMTSDVPPNTEIRATLDTPLSSKTSQPGDRFTATISRPVMGHSGVVIPAGARVEGEVSEPEQGKAVATLHTKGTLNLRLRDVVLPNGLTVPLAATLVSVNRTMGMNLPQGDSESEANSATRGSALAKDTNIGATGGNGVVFAGPLKGLAIGALSGGGYVLATNGRYVNLPAETGMVIRLDQGLNIQY